MVYPPSTAQKYNSECMHKQQKYPKRKNRKKKKKKGNERVLSVYLKKESKKPQNDGSQKKRF